MYVTHGLFGGVFRIDVDMDPAKGHPPPPHTPVSSDPAKPISIFTRQGYFIPNDNPFVGAALLARIESNEPILRNAPARSRGDEEGAALVEAWIGSL